MADNKPQQGNTLAARLARLGLKSDSDFVLHLPLRYEDETRITALADARPGVAAQFEVEVTDCEIAYRPRRQMLARVRDASGALSLRFLNFYPSQQKVLQPGARLRVFGEVHEGYLGPEIIHPRFHVVAAGERVGSGGSGLNAKNTHWALCRMSSAASKPGTPREGGEGGRASGKS